MYPDTYYSRTLVNEAAYPCLEETVRADVCVVGGGFAGLATALGLIERGKKVVLLERDRIGYGASGRNGGFVLSGYSLYPKALAKKVGDAQARELYDLSKQAQGLVRKRIDQYNIPCDPVHGHLITSWFDSPDDTKKTVEFMNDKMGETMEFWPREKVRDICRTDKYYDGTFEPDSFHMHPLSYAQGIAKAIADQGGLIFENSTALTLSESSAGHKVVTEKGIVEADQIVLCGSAYFNDLEKQLQRSCLSIRTNVLVTEPIAQDVLDTAIRERYAFRDDRWADDYYRILPDNRLLWGGGCSLGQTEPANLKDKMMADMLKIYPQLDGAVKADVVWSGLMGFTTSKMPHFGKLREGVWACTNVGGQGLNVTTVGGEAIAAAIAGEDTRYELFDPFKLKFDYTGGFLGPYVAQAVYHSWEVADRIREWRLNKRQAA